MACCPYASCPSFLLFSPSFFCLCPSFFCFSLAFLPLAIASSILCCLNRVASIVPCRFTHTLLLPPLCQRLFHTVLPQLCCLNRVLSFHSHPSFLFLPFACAYSIPCCLNCTHLPRLLFFSPILPWPLVFHVAIVPLCFNHTLLCSSWLPLALIIIHA